IRHTGNTVSRKKQLVYGRNTRSLSLRLHFPMLDKLPCVEPVKWHCSAIVSRPDLSTAALYRIASSESTPSRGRCLSHCSTALDQVHACMLQGLQNAARLYKMLPQETSRISNCSARCSVPSDNLASPFHTARYGQMLRRESSKLTRCPAPTVSTLCNRQQLFD